MNSYYSKAMAPNFEQAILIFQLLIVFQIKHFLADYPLQTEYMLGKFKAKDWEMPLFSHAAVHALMTFGIVSYYLNDLRIAIFMGLFDLVVHFTVDRVKASPYLFGKYKPTEKMFWNALGADQFMHHITHYIVIFVIVYHTFV
jgi:hypothetical protein